MTIRAHPTRIATRDSRTVALAPKRADPVYLTPEHRIWRREVIRLSGGRCQAIVCNTPDRGRGQRLFADHVEELRDGGARLDPGNGVALCGACHTRKTVAARAVRLRQPPMAAEG
jgi:5-methylcytosine-specific restriction enzyme A